MSTEQFACPHCDGRFLIAASSAEQIMACPHCGRQVAIAPTIGIELASQPVVAGSDSLELAPPESPPFVPFDFRDSQLPPPVAPPSSEPDPFAPGRLQLGRSARRRRTLRSLIVMLACLAILAGAVVLASRF
jgi:hypothetical protein